MALSAHSLSHAPHPLARSPQIGAQPTGEEWNLEDGKVARVGGVAVVVEALGRPEAQANLKILDLE